MQIRNYYNKTDLPPYGKAEVETNRRTYGPNLSVIMIDVDMENDTEVVSTPDEAGTTHGSPNGAHQQNCQAPGVDYSASDLAKETHYSLSRRMNLFVYTQPCRTSLQ